MALALKADDSCSSTPLVSIAEPTRFEDGRDETGTGSLDNHAARFSKGPLYDFLERRSDMNLAGKISNFNTQGGHGGSSDIFVGLYCPGNGKQIKVAVKKLRAHVMDDRRFQKTLARELYIWSKLKHPRILPLEGFYIEDNGYPCLISKWMERGTVLKYLHVNPTADLLSLVIGIAEGIHFLHTSEIVHSDIKPDNVLISDLGEPVLCDFGVSRMLAATGTFPVTSTMTGGPYGTIRYMSKDIVHSESSRHTVASDVWAFGMTVFTLLTKHPPYHELASEVRVLLAIVDGVLPSWPDDIRSWPIQNQILQRMCEFCWEEPSIRPSMGVFVSELRDLNRMLRHLVSNIDALDYEFRHLGEYTSINPAAVATNDHATSVPSSESMLSQGLTESCMRFEDPLTPPRKHKASGTADHLSPDKISCNFIVDGYQFTFDATLSPGSPPFTSKSAWIYYDDSEELTGTQSYTGIIGVSSYSLTLRNGTVIIGKRDVSRLESMLRIIGSGIWLSS